MFSFNPSHSSFLMLRMKNIFLHFCIHIHFVLPFIRFDLDGTFRSSSVSLTTTNIVLPRLIRLFQYRLMFIKIWYPDFLVLVLPLISTSQVLTIICIPITTRRTNPSFYFLQKSTLFHVFFRFELCPFDISLTAVIANKVIWVCFLIF